ERVQQFVGNILATARQLLEGTDPAGKQLVHFLVRIDERIPGLFHQGFLEGEVRQGVVHQLVEHFVQFFGAMGELGVLYLVDVLDDALVLAVDYRDADGKVLGPGQGHVRYSTANDLSRELIGREHEEYRHRSIERMRRTGKRARP